MIFTQLIKGKSSKEMYACADTLSFEGPDVSTRIFRIGTAVLGPSGHMLKRYFDVRHTTGVRRLPA